MDAQDRTDGVCELRSPLRKLVRFFQRSRDQWKRKAQERKQACERMGNQVRAVTASRDKWRTLQDEHFAAPSLIASTSPSTLLNFRQGNTRRRRENDTLAG